MNKRLLPREHRPYQWRAVIVTPRWPEMILADELLIDAAMQDESSPDVVGALAAASGGDIRSAQVIATITAVNGDRHQAYVNRDTQNDKPQKLALLSSIRGDASATTTCATCYGDILILGESRQVKDQFLPTAQATIPLAEIYHLILPGGHKHIGISHAGMMS